MKAITFVVYLAIGFQFRAQGSSETGETNDQETMTYAIKERGAHHKILKRIEYETRSDGTTVPHVHSYTELATGMHYQKDGQWVESKAAIEILPDGAGAKADQGQHKVIFPANINDGLIELNTPDGKWLRSRLVGLSYYDTGNGESVIIAETRDSVGELQGQNVVVYPEAFADLRADVRYTYTLAGFEQDIILREQPPSPTGFGLNPETTRLEVLTEFIDPPTPVKMMREMNGLVDENLDFGVIKIGRGRAFSLGNETGPGWGQPVMKRWEKLEGRDFLIEQVEFEAVKGELDKLPVRTAMNSEPGTTGTAERHAARIRTLPAARTAEKTSTNRFVVAKAEVNQQPGYVLDYTTINSSQTNYTFKGDTTYYISGAVNLFGTTTIEGGTVVKYSPLTATYLGIYDSVTCQTAPYRPAVFTSRDDDSLGEIISGSTGSPVVDTVGNYYIVLNDVGDAVLHHLRLAYSYCGITVVNESAELDDIQFVHGDYPVYTVNVPTLNVRNVLMHDVREAAFYLSDGDAAKVEHLTVNQCKYLAYVEFGVAMVFTNCLFDSVTNWGTTFSGSHNATNNGGGSFQQVGGGNHYLNTNSSYRNAGTTNIGAASLAILRRTTTYPPIVYSNATVSVPTNFGVQAQRDTDIPDLGYHYDPLDYAFGGTDVNTNITFDAGTAVGWFRTSSGWTYAGHGIHVDDRQAVTFDGTQESPCYWVRANTVQERGGNTVWQGGYGPGGMTSWADQYGSITNAAIVNARFLTCSAVTGDIGNHFRDDYGILIGRFRDSEFFNSGIQGYNSSFYFTNCLFHRAGAGGMNEGMPGNTFVAQNCTWLGGSVYLTPTYAISNIIIKDCALDGATVTASGYATNSSYARYDYNAYTNATNLFLIGGSSDKQSVSFNWQSGTLGNFYLPTNSVLINAGSTNAHLLGLYHFTTQTNQVKETNSTVDIGFHYVAVTNGTPFDMDNDGLPDYFEDVNGDGSYNTGDLADWTEPDTDGDGMPDGWEVTHGLNPLVNDASLDPDEDGVNNYQEYLAGTHPQYGPDWSFVQMGDLHAGNVLWGPSFTNAINTFISNKAAWNIKLFISAGDLYMNYGYIPFFTDDGEEFCAASMTNQLWRLRNAGISVMAVEGNHEEQYAHESPYPWNSVFGTNFYANEPMYFTNRLVNDTRDFAMKMTNGLSKYLFVGLGWINNPDTNYAYAPVFATTNDMIAAYSNSCVWAKNLAVSFSNHQVIAVCHYFVDTNGTPSTKDLTSSPDDPTQSLSEYVNIGPGIALWNQLKTLSNPILVVSGHVRQNHMTVSTLTANDGHTVQSVKLNTQRGHEIIGTNQLNNGGTFVLYTVQPALHRVVAKVYATELGRFLVEGEGADLDYKPELSFPTE